VETPAVEVKAAAKPHSAQANDAAEAGVVPIVPEVGAAPEVDVEPAAAEVEAAAETAAPVEAIPVAPPSSAGAARMGRQRGGEADRRGD
jgi:hypothetical protein